MIKRWKEVAREVIFEKFSRKLLKVDFELPDGVVSDFYIKEEGPAVSILALTPENNVILVQQFRPGPQKIFTGLPGGFVDKGENPVEAGKRELLEETGYTGNFEKVVDCYDDAYSTMLRTVLVATDCKKVQEQQLEATEHAEVHFASLEEFREILRSGQMTDVEVGYLALDYLGFL